MTRVTAQERISRDLEIASYLAMTGTYSTLGIVADSPQPPTGGEDLQRIARRLCFALPERPD
jgi:hypothetical protein